MKEIADFKSEIVKMDKFKQTDSSKSLIDSLTFATEEKNEN